MSTETNKMTNHIILEKNTENCRYINKTDVKNCFLQFSLLNKTKRNVQMLFYLTAQNAVYILHQIRPYP